MVFKTQHVVVLSSCEATYIALADIVKEILGLGQVQQFGTPNKNDVSIQTFGDNQFGDNQGAIKLANNPVSSKRTRHIDVKHDFIRG